VKTLRIGAMSFGPAHYRLVHAIIYNGIQVGTDYDKQDEQKSLDLSVALEICEPWNPPIFSKCVYDTPKGLIQYRDEVLFGTHDELSDKLSYTYHNRFKSQLDGVIEELQRNPQTRRAQLITWKPETDLGAEYPPCFQRAWFRVLDKKLDMHTTWRSRDCWKAWGSNVFAFAHLHKHLSERLNVPIGTYVEWIDSAHIYGRDIEQATKALERPVREWCWSLEDIMSVAS